MLSNRWLKITNHLYIMIYLGPAFQQPSCFLIVHEANTNGHFINTKLKKRKLINPYLNKLIIS